MNEIVVIAIIVLTFFSSVILDVIVFFRRKNKQNKIIREYEKQHVQSQKLVNLPTEESPNLPLYSFENVNNFDKTKIGIPKFVSNKKEE